MKYIHVYALFLITGFLTSCRQNHTTAPKDNIKSGTKDTVTTCGPNGMARNVKQDRNGDILTASYFGVVRYDARLPARARSDGNDGIGLGKSFAIITSTMSSSSLAEFQTYL
jgi:hypothetical protein